MEKVNKLESRLRVQHVEKNHMLYKEPVTYYPKVLFLLKLMVISLWSKFAVSFSCLCSQPNAKTWMSLSSLVPQWENGKTSAFWGTLTIVVSLGWDLLRWIWMSSVKLAIIHFPTFHCPSALLGSDRAWMGQMRANKNSIFMLAGNRGSFDKMSSLIQ